MHWTWCGEGAIPLEHHGLVMLRLPDSWGSPWLSNPRSSKHLCRAGDPARSTDLLPLGKTTLQWFPSPFCHRLKNCTIKTSSQHNAPRTSYAFEVRKRPRDAKEIVTEKLGLKTTCSKPYLSCSEVLPCSLTYNLYCPTLTTSEPDLMADADRHMHMKVRPPDAP